MSWWLTCKIPNLSGSDVGASLESNDSVSVASYLLLREIPLVLGWHLGPDGGTGVVLVVLGQPPQREQAENNLGVHMVKIIIIMVVQIFKWKLDRALENEYNDYLLYFVRIVNITYVLCRTSSKCISTTEETNSSQISPEGCSSSRRGLLSGIVQSPGHRIS